MRLRLFFVEEQIKGNQRRREAEGLPWLEYHAAQHEIGEAVMAAEKITGRTIRVGLWSNREVPRDVIIIGKWVGDPDEPELPLCTVQGATLPVGKGGVPAPKPNRASSTERMLAKLAIRLIRLEKKVSFYRLLTLFTLIGLISMAWMLALSFFRR